MSFLGESLAIEIGEFSGEDGTGSWDQGCGAVPKVSDRRRGGPVRRRLRIHQSGNVRAFSFPVRRFDLDLEDVER